MATGIFVAGVAIPGGPAIGDAFEIIYPTWAFSHGQFVLHVPAAPRERSQPLPPRSTRIIAGAIGFVTQHRQQRLLPLGTALGP